MKLVRHRDGFSSRAPCEDDEVVNTDDYQPINFTDNWEPGKRLSVFNEEDGKEPKDNQYINGYFVGDMYAPILEYLQPIEKLRYLNRYALGEINRSDSVSIHFRRTDYLAKEHEYFSGICTDEYYRNSISRMSGTVEDAVFFVFSDDPAYARSFFKKHYPRADYRVIMNNRDGRKSFLDLFLMSQCKHNIIANSTFSWWGAFLNRNSDKIVLCPERYQKDSDRNIYPSDWIRVPSK